MDYDETSPDLGQDHTLMDVLLEPKVIGMASMEDLNAEDLRSMDTLAMCEDAYLDLHIDTPLFPNLWGLDSDDHKHPSNLDVRGKNDNLVPQEVIDEIPDAHQKLIGESDGSSVWTKDQTTTTRGGLETGQGGPVNEKFANCKTATDIFLVFFNGELRQNIIRETNLHAKRHSQHFLPLLDSELLGFIGINILMGYHKLPSYKHYFCSDADLNVPIVGETMARDRFAGILTNLHLNDTSAIPSDASDDLNNWRPYLDFLNDAYGKLWHPDQKQWIFESARFKEGPVKDDNSVSREYKVFVRSEMSGFTNQFEVYPVMSDNIHFAKSSGSLELGEKVITELCRPISAGGHDFYFDYLFTSLPLLEHLKANGVNACGAIRMSRIGSPKILPSDKSQKHGDSEFWPSNTGITVAKWNNHIVASNFHDTETTQRVQNGGFEVDSFQSMIWDYEAQRKGAAKILKSPHNLNRKSQSLLHRIFFYSLDVTMMNAFLVHCRLLEDVSAFSFRRKVAMGLLTLARNTKEQRGKRSRPCLSSLDGQSTQKRRKLGYSVPDDVRLSKCQHWVDFKKKRGRCEYCACNSVESRPFTMCSVCKVYLCFNNKKNCVPLYHEPIMSVGDEFAKTVQV